jgi:hyaluronoglucosaminidase
LQHIFLADATVAIDVSSWRISPRNLTQCGVGCTTTNCTPWNPPFPFIDNSGVAHFGGVPQAGNLSAHLQYIRDNIDGWLPDPDYAGNAVFDFENWTPLWEENNNPGSSWHGTAYQNLSLALVRSAHPDWNESQVNSTAAAEFEAAGTAYFVQTLQLCVSLRPKAAWGFYGFPQNLDRPCVGNIDNPQCGYRNPALGPAQRAANERLAQLWAVQTGFFPSVYLNDGTNSSGFPAACNADYIAGNTAEAVRLRDKYAPTAPVLPFTWAYYHAGVTLLAPWDMAASFDVPPENGAQGVLLWGAAGYFKQMPEFLAYLNTTAGPLAFAEVTRECGSIQEDVF